MNSDSQSNINPASSEVEPSFINKSNEYLSNEQESKELNNDNFNDIKNMKNEENDVEKSKERDRDRDRDRERDRSSRHSSRRDRSRKREHHSRRDRSKSKEKDRHSSRHTSHSKTRERSRDRDRDRERDRDRDRERRRRHRSRSRSSRYDRSRSPRRERSVTPIHLKKRKLNNWDVPPQGYEGMTVEQVKATGHFPLAVQAPKITDLVVNTPVSHLQNGLTIDQSKRFAVATKNVQNIQGTMNPATLAIKQAKRLYVGNIPFGITEKELVDFFNNKMIEYKFSQSPGDSVVGAQIEKNYAFIEFRDPEESTIAMKLDGIPCNGQLLKIRRPKNYQPPEGQGADPQPIHAPLLTNVSDSPNKIFIGGLPDHLNDENVLDILKSFGPLRAFNLVKDRTTGISKGYAFCEYMDPSVTDTVCQGLNNLEMGDKKLVVQRASIGANKVIPPTTSFQYFLPLIQMGTNGKDATRILLLLNMVSEEELVNDEEYQDIMEDIKDECSNFGKVLSIKIPRPVENKEVSGVGKIYVEYETIEQSMTAFKSLTGRKFADRTVVTSYYDEAKYLADDL